MDNLTDAAKRASDLINCYRVSHPWNYLKNCFVAIRLSDGGHDGVLYESRRDAVSHQLDEKLCAYVCFRNLANGASARDMEIFLKFNRDAYDAGYRLTDPDDQFGGQELIMTAPQFDYRKGLYRGFN